MIESILDHWMIESSTDFWMFVVILVTCGAVFLEVARRLINRIMKR